MAWHPSQRPRKARVRAFKRAVVQTAPTYLQAYCPRDVLSDEDLDAILSLIPNRINVDIFKHLLAGVARRYVSAAAASVIARPVTLASIRMIAHQAWRLSVKHPAASTRALKAAIEHADLNAQTLLMKEMRRLHNAGSPLTFPDLYRSYTRPTLIRVAARAIERRFNKRGGDYANTPVRKAIGFLIFLFDAAGNAFPTFSRTGSGPVGVGTRRQIAGSAFGRFVLEFFSRIDPNLSQTLVSNSADQELTKVRGIRQSGQSYFRDVSNIWSEDRPLLWPSDLFFERGSNAKAQTQT